MVWDEFLVDRWLSDSEIADALSAVFGVEVAAIVVERETRARPPLGEGVRVLCEVAAAKGDFPLYLSVFVRDERISIPDRLTGVKRLCERRGCACLLSDDSPDPYAMLLVRADGSVTRVFVDVARLDDEDEVVVVGEAPATA